MNGRSLHATLSTGVLAVAFALVVAGAAQAAVAPRITSGPSIAGTPQVGEQLTATATWTGDPAPDATWRWLRCVKDVDTCSTIGGATTAAYRPTATDVGAVLRVRLTVRNSAGSDVERSAPTAAVAAAPVATPTPTPTPISTPTSTPTPTPTPSVTPTPSEEPTPTPDQATAFDVVPVAASPTPSPAAAPTSRPRLLKPFPVIRMRGLLVQSGARVTLLSVRAPRGVRIVVRCRGADCPVRRYTARPAVRRLRPFEREFRAGTRLEITVTKPGLIGKRTVFVIRTGAAPRRSDRCVDPETQRVMRCPSG